MTEDTEKTDPLIVQIVENIHKMTDERMVTEEWYPNTSHSPISLSLSCLLSKGAMQINRLRHPLQLLNQIRKRSRQLAVSNSDPEPVDTTVHADPRVFPVPIGNETFLDIDGLDTGRIRIRHEHDQFVIVVCEKDRDSNQDIAEQIEIPRTEETTGN